MTDASPPAVGRLHHVVIDVNDLATGEAFWSRLLGLEVRYSAFEGLFSGIGRGPGSLLLQLVPETKTATKNRVHVDVAVEDLARAVEEVVAMGGRIVSPPGAPMPASPDLEWAVMADPFGNEFCLVQERAYDT